MKVLITDYHVGCQMWQYSALKQLNYDVEIYSLSGHTHYLDMLNVPYKKINSNFYKNNYDSLLKFDIFIISFWPSHAIYPFNFIEFCEKHNKKLILNCGHRFNIRTDSSIHENMIDSLSILKNSSKHILAVMSEYDYHYIKHYTGIESCKLYVYSHHIPASITNQNILVDNNKINTILIGPAHNTTKIDPFNNLNELNELSKNGSISHTSNLIKFNFIKNLHPNYNYIDLINYKACLIYPYSAFSISTVEIYNLNIPIIVPSIELLIQYKICDDVCLFPTYCSEKDYQLLNYKNNKTEYNYDPNSYNNDDLQFWLQYIYVYTKKNVIIFNSKEDLINKIYTINFDNIRNEMIKENEIEKINSLKEWKNIIENKNS